MLDLGLPDIDGIDFIRDLRSWSEAPIIVLSARSTEADPMQPFGEACRAELLSMRKLA